MEHKMLNNLKVRFLEILLLVVMFNKKIVMKIQNNWGSRSTQQIKFFYLFKHLNLSLFSHYEIDINKNTKSLLQLIDKEKPDFIVDFAGQEW